MAVGLLTLWMEPDMDEKTTTAEYLSQVLTEGIQQRADSITDAETAVTATVEAAMPVLTGQLNLSMFLLCMLAKERGATSDAEIQDKASEILRDFSIRLPE